MNNRSATQTTLIIVLASALLLLLSWLSISTLTFATSDTGLRFLQIQALIDQQWSSFAIDYPTRFVDPELQHVPYYAAYIVLDDELYLRISPFFPLIASKLYALIGRLALPIIPATSSVLAGLTIYRLARMSKLAHPYFAFLGTIFATPLLFYSLELWDHTLGVALAMGGVYGAVAGLLNKQWQPIFWGGIALGVATGQRTELHIFAVAVVMSLLIMSRLNWRFTLAVVTGGLAGVIPVWWLQYIWFNHLLAPVTAPALFNYGRPKLPSFSSRPITPAMDKGYFLTYIEPRDAITFVATLLVVFGLALFILALRVKNWRTPRFLSGAFIIAGLGYLLFASVALDDAIPGLLPTFPLMALSATYVESKEDERATGRSIYQFVLLTALSFLTLMLLLWPGYGGWQWGARYLLPAYPLLLYLALYVYTVYQRRLVGSMRSVFRWTAGGLLLMSIFLQILGIRLLYVSHYNQIPVLKTIQDMPVDFVLTNLPYFPSFMTAAHDTTFIYVRDSQDFDSMKKRLAGQGVDKIGVIAHETAPLEGPDSFLVLPTEPLRFFIYELEAKIDQIAPGD